MSYCVFCLCLVYSDVQHFAVAHFVFKFSLLVFSFVCLRPVSCVPNNASFSGLSILDFPFGFHSHFLKMPMVKRKKLKGQTMI